MKISEAFKLRLQECLDERSTTLFKLCRENGIGRSTIINLYKGNSRSPKLATLYEICDALNISILEFLNSPLFSRENVELE